MSTHYYFPKNVNPFSCSHTGYITEGGSFVINNFDVAICDIKKTMPSLLLRLEVTICDFQLDILGKWHALGTMILQFCDVTVVGR